MQNSQLQTAKTLSFIGAIVAIVLGALYCLTVLGIIMGVPMIVGGVLLLKFRDYSDDVFYEHRGALLGWGIFFLFCTVIGGVLELIAYFQVNSYVSGGAEQRSAMDFSSVERAYDLKEKGVISASEFDDIKAAALRQEGVQATPTDNGETAGTTASATDDDQAASAADSQSLMDDSVAPSASQSTVTASANADGTQSEATESTKAVDSQSATVESSSTTGSQSVGGELQQYTESESKIVDDKGSDTNNNQHKG
ncbi:DUF5362 family protein [Lacticaseibacillus pantheris]|uniref:DUF5362 family protein n=1 Tax=Lacticaseibacillus pantheris TaxID=171523 RepID=UPI002658F341|nr:DUF5362 family protein [Lacticaseibacillus pantheris]WKF84564.1 DUF5362 family protein [Lacticaseibacillus pantheris]